MYKNVKNKYMYNGLTVMRLSANCKLTLLPLQYAPNPAILQV